MDYIYGELNIPSKNKSYGGEETDFFNTDISDVYDYTKSITPYFLLSNLVNLLEAVPLKCSNRKYKEKWVRPCSQTLLVGSKVLDIVGEYPTYDYEVDGDVVRITNAPFTIRGGVVFIQ